MNNQNKLSITLSDDEIAILLALEVTLDSPSIEDAILTGIVAQIRKQGHGRPDSPKQD